MAVVPDAVTRRPGYRSALRSRDFRLLLSALTVSSVGTWAYGVALAVWLFDRTHAVGWVAAASLARFLPSLLFSTYAGVLADRFERIRLLVSCDVVSTALQTGLAVTAALNGPVVLVVGLAAGSSLVSRVREPAVAATVPHVVGEEDLAAANALSSTVDNLVLIAGPALGAALLVLGPPPVVFAVNTATFVVSAGLLSRMRTRSRPADVGQGGRAGPLRQMTVGLRAVLASPAAKVLVAFSVLASFLYGADTVWLVPLSRFQFHTGANGYGYLLAGEGLGGVLAASVVNRLARSRRLALVIVAGMAGYALPVALYPLIHPPGVAFALQLVRGAGTLVVDVLAMSALQRSVPREVLARVFGVYFALAIGAISLGALLVPVLLHPLGLHGTLLAMSLGVAGMTVLGYPALHRVDRAAAARAAELQPRVAVLRALPVFAAAPEPVLERLAAACVEQAVPAGHTLLREGDPADDFYVLVDGAVQVGSRGAGGQPQTVRIMTGGSYFGEIGLLGRIPRTATVTTTAPCRLYRISGGDFLSALSDSTAYPSLLEGAKTRLAVTHPAYLPAGFAAPAS